MAADEARENARGADRARVRSDIILARGCARTIKHTQDVAAGMLLSRCGIRATRDRGAMGRLSLDGEKTKFWKRDLLRKSRAHTFEVPIIGRSSMDGNFPLETSRGANGTGAQWPTSARPWKPLFAIGDRDSVEAVILL